MAKEVVGGRGAPWGGTGAVLRLGTLLRGVASWAIMEGATDYFESVAAWSSNNTLLMRFLRLSFACL